MAAKSTIAKRYARALSQVFADSNKASVALGELETLVRTVAADAKLAAFLQSPAFDRDEKWAVLSEVLNKAGATKDTAQFLRVLLDADRVLILEEVLAEFKKVLMDAMGEAEARVESAYALTESEVALIQANLEKTVGKKLRISVETKPELIAGLRVTADGKTFDGTLSTHLTRLHRQLSQAEA